MKTTGYNSLNSWFALLATSIIAFFSVLPMRLIGLLFVVIKEHYNTDREHATIPIVMFGVLRTLLGPLTGYLGEIWGCQAITLFGCVLTAVGIGSCYFAETATSVIICFGLITGMFLILSAILLNCVPAAIFLRDPKYDEQISKFEKRAKTLKSTRKDSANYDNLTFVSDEDQKSNNCFQSEQPKQNALKEGQLEQSANDSNQPTCVSIEKKQHCLEPPIAVQLVRFSEIIEKNYGTTTTNCELQPKAKQNLEQSSFIPEKKSAGWQLKHLFTDPVFYLIMLITSVHTFVITTNWTVIVDFALDKDIPIESSVYLVMFLPLAELFGNICLYWVVDKEFMSSANYSTLCFILIAIDTQFIYWSPNFFWAMISVMLFGFISGAVRSTFPGMVYDYIDKDKQNMAMASRTLPYAALCFAKAPVIGYFREQLGSYKYVYYLIAACSILSALISLLTPVVASYTARRKTESKDSIRVV